MTEPKRNPNPFIRMAQEAKRKREEQEQSILEQHQKPDANIVKKPMKPQQGFSGPKVMRRSGRGG